MNNEALIPDASNEEVSVGGQTQLAQPQQQSLRDAVEQAMENYFRHLDGQMVTDVYDMVLSEIEAPMLEVVMKHTRHNQTRAAQLLGLNRGTLRKKLKRYGLL
ncbi:DNA-binding transcriptional regulator Fis [Microbulbifer thermotolerans]|uniref:Putative Fis-like DNA-binding protein n=1 Tax=Microbulbifer thermotolerans TaxID=252514 RepID=A0A143HII8_MICTH|nr:DNA-binding transcriptional regulator Fis [Microbulbifer thermotolerans]AMX01538.1 methyltransferase [Microbulbifer thermotolerans]MCX2778390.1 DNA-binding transcriptional regulator Fis [Microbulbifer thermotolerans]MCX2784192.1 DNA-binding transcriptional regulator Fis [Microbulbifer thermotolerans]MCX2796159.1 DNA-binding transcriptional regulator Fis [Microbulbifer thermotolerans]MCX2803026.1 DNA-binding transcriptional regulator Fis [Microbulbifer thermotolerans]